MINGIGNSAYLYQTQQLRDSRTEGVEGAGGVQNVTSTSSLSIPTEVRGVDEVALGSGREETPLYNNRGAVTTSFVQGGIPSDENDA